MSKILKGSFELMKQLNVAAILNVIKNNGSLSRADIAKITGLTPASITNITKELIEGEYLLERGIGESSGGRPPIILELNLNARYIVGVSIGVGSIDGVVTNIGGEILSKKSIPISEENVNIDYVFTKLIKLINEVISISDISRDKIIGIGVAMHGIVNASTGVSEYAPYYHWESIDIKKGIESRINYPVFVDNDVRAMALGESWFGVAKGIDNFIAVNISNGVGAGIIINNKPYYGVDYSAGEIGHVVVEADGTKCNCGNYGCLETVASNNNIVKKVNKSIKQGAISSISLEDVENITIDEVCIASLRGDELSINVIKEAARYIGIGLSNLVNILNPKFIVLVGEIFEQTSYALDTIEMVIKKRGLKVSTEKVKIIKSELGENAAVIGAVTLVIQELFNGREFGQ